MAPKKRGTRYLKVPSKTADESTEPEELEPTGPRLRRGEPFIERSQRAELLGQLEQQGREAARELVTSSGPYLSVREAAEELNISPGEVREAVEEKRLIGVETPYFTDLRLPEWQIGDGASVVSGLEQVLEVFGAKDVTETLLFLRAPSPQHDGQSPLDLLHRGLIDEALNLARSHGEHGGR